MNKKKNGKKNRSLEDNIDHTSSKGKILGNSPRRSNVDYKTMETETVMRVEKIPNVDNIANQIVIETSFSF